MTGQMAEAARTVRKVRTQAEAGWLSAELGQVESETTESEAPQRRKERRSFWQKIFPVFFLEETEEEALIDDRKPESNGTVGGAEASASNAETATASNSAAFDFQETEASDEAEEVSIQWILKSHFRGMRQLVRRFTGLSAVRHDQEEAVEICLRMPITAA